MSHKSSRIIAHIILFIVALIFIAIVYRLSLESDTVTNKCRIQKLKKNAKTGDLIGVSYTTIHGKLVKFFTASMWTHMSMIIELYDDEIETDENGKIQIANIDNNVNRNHFIQRSKPSKYTIEIARYNWNNRGVIIMPLDNWLKWNSKRILVWRKYDHKSNNFPIKSLKHKLRQTIKSTDNMNVVTWLKTMYRRTYIQPEKNGSYYCSEYICMLLQEINVLKKLHDPGCYQPWEMIYGKLPLEFGHNYLEPSMLN